MSKQNTALLLNRYIWLLDTLYTAGSLSREEIDRRWSRSSLKTVQLVFDLIYDSEFFTI